MSSKPNQDVVAMRPHMEQYQPRRVAGVLDRSSESSGFLVKGHERGRRSQPH